MSEWTRLQRSITQWARSLDDVGFDVGRTHISLFNAVWWIFVVILVDGLFAMFYAAIDF